MYAYCNNNHVNLVDPTGQFAWAIPVIPALVEAAKAIVATVVVAVTVYVADEVETEIRTSARPKTEAIPRTNTKRKPPKTEVHHIVAQKAPQAAPSREIFKKINMDVHYSANLVPLEYAIHRRIHTTAYYSWVNNVVINAYNQAGNNQTAQKINVERTLWELGRDIQRGNIGM